MSEQKNIAKQKNRRKKRISRRILTYSFIFVLMFELIFRFLATPILRSSIQSYVEKASKGLYHVDFERISLTFSNTGLELINFKLIPDTAIYRQRKADGTVKTALYAVELESLHFKRLKIRQLYKFNVLHFKFMEINGLSLTILGLPDKAETKNEKYDAVHQDLYQIIKPHLKALRIDVVKLNDGHFDMRAQRKPDEKSKTQAEKISVSLKNFSLDSASFQARDKLFYSDSLHIIVDKYSLLLNDGVHQVRAEQVVMSVADSTIILKQAGLYPMFAKQSLSTKSHFYIHFPSIKLTGTDIYRAWFDREINIADFTTKKPILKIIGGVKQKKQAADSTKTSLKTSDFRQLYDLIEGKITHISIGNFNLEDANFEIIRGEAKQAEFAIENFSISLDHFRLDKQSEMQTDKFLYSDNIEMSVKDYRMQVAKHTHELSVDSLLFSTKSKRIEAYNLKIRPLKGVVSRKTAMTITVPELQLLDADFIRAYNTSKLSVNQFIAKNSTIDLKQNSQTDADTKIKQKSNNSKADVVYELISEYLSELKIEEFRIDNSDLTFQKNFSDEKSAFYKGNISLGLQNFLIDENTATESDRLFYATGFDIELNDYSMKSARDLHIFELGKLRISTKDSIIEIRKLSFYPKISKSVTEQMKLYGKNSLVNIYTDIVVMNNTDVKALLFDKTLTASNINIINPKIFLQKFQSATPRDSSKISTFGRLFPFNESNETTDSEEIDSIAIDNASYKSVIASMLSAFIKTVDIQKFSIDSGYVHHTNYDSTGRMRTYAESYFAGTIREIKLHTDTSHNAQPVLGGQTELNFFDIAFRLPDRLHTLRLGSLKFRNTDSSLTMYNFRLIPDSNPLEKNAHTLYIPVLKIRGIETEALLTKHELNTELIESEGIRYILSKPEIRTTEKKESKPFVLPKALKKITCNKLLFTDGKFQIVSRTDTGEVEEAMADFAFLFENIESVNTSKRIPFDADKTDIMLSKVHYRLPDKIYHLTADSLFLTPKHNFLSAVNLNFSYDSVKLSKSIPQKKSALSMQIPKLRAAGINTEAFISEKSIDIEQINLTSPHFVFDKFENSGKAFNINDFETMLYEKLTKKNKNIHIQTLEFTSAKFAQNNFPKQKHTELDQLFGTISDFDTDTTKRSESRLFFADDIQISKKNFRTITKDSLNLITAKELSVSTKEKSVGITNFAMQPTLDKYEFSQKFAFRKSMTFIDNADITLTDIDFKRLAEQKKLFAERALINNLDLYIFSDSRKPENTNDTLKIDPWLRVHEVKLPFTVRKTEITNAEIRFEQQTDKSPKSGVLTLNRTKLNISNLSNEPEEISKNQLLKVVVTTYLQDTAYVKLTFRLPLDKTLKTYSFAGLADTFDLRILNPFIENAILFSVNKGQVNKLSFFVNVDNDEAEGDMNLFYQDMSIQRIDTSADVDVFTSGVANVALRNNNPRHPNRKLSKLRQGKIYYKKPGYKSSISMWTQALITGVVTSVVSFKTPEMRRQGKMKREVEKLLKKEERKKTRKINKKRNELNNELDRQTNPQTDHKDSKP